jgi:putative endonuclease
MYLMHFVYVLYSAKFDRSYVGMTKNVKQRLSQHNSGMNTSTKAFVPWEVVHVEIYETQIEARDREKYLKSAAGRRWRKKNIRPRARPYRTKFEVYLEYWSYGTFGRGAT